MGYYTDFKLEVMKFNKDEEYSLEDKALDLKAIQDDLSKINGWNILDFNKFQNQVYLYANAKWYDYNQDLSSLSKKYNELVFILNGQGEESGDVWRNYYHEGRCQEEVPSFPEFSPDKLKFINLNPK